MTIEEFMSTVDAIRFDTDLDETAPELRALAQKCYPIIRKLYNEMEANSMLSESKKFYPKEKGEQDGNFKIKKVPFKKASKKVDLRTDFEEYDDERIDEAVSKAIRKVLKNK